MALIYRMVTYLRLLNRYGDGERHPIEENVDIDNTYWLIPLLSKLAQSNKSNIETGLEIVEYTYFMFIVIIGFVSLQLLDEVILRQRINTISLLEIGFILSFLNA